MKTLSKWTTVGYIGVDAGICWIGDPCYVLHKEGADKPEAIGKNWLEFCDKLQDRHTQFDYSPGHPGLGVVVSTGYGDGQYPVQVKYNNEGRVVQVRVKFE